jgi:hypothetical protein
VVADDLVAEARAADEDRAGVVEHGGDGGLVGRAARADPVPVAALDRHDRRQAGAAGGLQHREAGRVAVLRVQHVERLLGVQALDDVCASSAVSRSKSPAGPSPRGWLAPPRARRPGTRSAGGGPPP